MAHGQEKYLTVQANTHIGTCSNCRRPVNVQAWGDHICLIDTDKSLGDILGDALAERNDQNMITIPATLLTDVMHQQEKLTEAMTEHNANALIAKLYECVASHYENGDRTGAEAIINAIQFAQQEN